MTLPDGEHAFEGDLRPPYDLFGQLHPGREVAQAVPQLLERVPLHIGALGAVAVLVGDEVEPLARRQLVKGVAHAALGAADKAAIAFEKASKSGERAPSEGAYYKALALQNALRRIYPPYFDPEKKQAALETYRELVKRDPENGQVVSGYLAASVDMNQDADEAIAAGTLLPMLRLVGATAR